MTTITRHHLNTTNVYVDTTAPVIELKLHDDNSVDDLDGNCWRPDNSKQYV